MYYFSRALLLSGDVVAMETRIILLAWQLLLMVCSSQCDGHVTTVILQAASDPHVY